MSTILKCKMCGGDIEVSKDMSVGTCLYCGSTMTLPRIDTDKKARMFNRANQYRMENEFDKAYRVYEAILEEDAEEAEAYWGLILSEYGVEYVVDPKTQKRVPTCHRTQTKLIKSSSNYENAIKYADSESRFIYEDEATKIDNIQKKILTISYKEEPYDVFICYKESDVNGERTEDSVLAQSIYDELEQKGIKTFFARISLEDKLGKDYEPYIFSALNSAKVMLVVTTCNEHCEAVWVRNEWSRYLRFMEDGNKTLIPVFKTMSPYELPDELSKFQAQDMGKVGAIQDLVRGVQKLLGQTKTEKDNAALNELLAEKLEREKNESKRQKNRKLVKKVFIGIIACILLAIAVLKIFIIPMQTYNKAIEARRQNNFETSLLYLEKLDENYKDVSELKKEMTYRVAMEVYKNTEQAIEYFEKIVEYKDSREHLIQLNMREYQQAFSSAKYGQAIRALENAVGYVDNMDDFLHSWEPTLNKVYSFGKRKYTEQNYGIAKQVFEILTLTDYKKSSQYLNEIIEIEDKSQSEYENILGKYKNTETGVYLIIKDNNRVYLTEYESDVDKDTYLLGWSYAYIQEKDFYQLFSEKRKYEVIENAGILEITGTFSANVALTNYEKLVVGTYEKID